MSDTTSVNDNEPVYIAYCVEDMTKSPRDFFKTVKEVSKFVNSPEGKSYGARFKKFGTPKEANDFLASGDAILSQTPRGGQLSRIQSPMAEPASPFPGVNRIQMNEIKKYIEKGNVEEFLRLVETNPRYLVNTGGDVASIIMEGFRYNALHIAAKAGQIEIIKKLLSFVNDCNFLQRLYGTSVEDVSLRQPNIIDSYLNTPDKGNCDTPLHFATKFGRVDVVREFVKQNLLDRNIKNKSAKTALESACERYNEPDKAQVLKQIELLIEGYYVWLVRDLEDVASLVVAQKIDGSVGKSKVCAVAGPFLNKALAENFKTKWLAVGKETKRTDFDKGYEKVGRTLCGNEVPKVGFSEFWRFLGADSSPIDVNSEDGLAVIEAFLKERRRNGDWNKERKIGADEKKSSRRKLDFDILDDEENLDESFEYDGDTFYDTLPYLESEISLNLNDSLSGLTDQFAALSFASPKRNGEQEKLVLRESEGLKKEEEEEDPEEEEYESFVTPPSSPPPTYVVDELPCKLDNDLFEVLVVLPKDLIEKYPLVESYVNKLGRLNPAVRCAWPGVDSPFRCSSLRAAKKQF